MPRIPDRRLREHRARPAPDPGARRHAAGTRPQERDDAARRARPLGRPRALRGGQPGRQGARLQGHPAGPRPQGQAAAGDDDGRPEGAVRAGGARRAGQRLHRRRRGLGQAWPTRSASIPGLDRAQPAPLRRLGVGLPRRRRHPADGGRAARHPRSVPGRRRARRPGGREAAGPRAGRGRQAPGLGLRRPAGGPRLGHRQPARAAEQPADRHGQHARGDAGPAEGPGLAGRRRRA